MGKNTQNNPVVRRAEFNETIGALAQILQEALNRTESLAEVTAGIALVLKENGLIDLGVEEHDDDTVSLDLNGIAAIGTEPLEPGPEA